MADPRVNGAQSAPPRRLSWNDPDVRSVVYQVVAVALVGIIGWFLVSNTLHNLSIRNISTGFDFLGRESGFAIGESPIAYGPENTYARAVLVGRPVLWGLATAGAAGAAHVLRLLRDELQLAMAQSGVANVGEISPGLLLP